MSLLRFVKDRLCLMMSFAFQQQRAMKYETFIDFSDENDCISEYVSRSSASFQGDRGVPGLRGERV